MRHFLVALQLANALQYGMRCTHFPNTCTLTLRFLAAIGAALLLLACTPALADVAMPAIFGDDMVLQQGADDPVWGTAEPGESVSVAFAGQKRSAVTGIDGKWRVDLSSMKASAVPQTMTVSGENQLTFHNILIGEVWVCSGQSNMELSVQSSLNWQDEVAKANFPTIRLFTVEHKIIHDPQSDVIVSRADPKRIVGVWQPCTPASVISFSAAAYYFGRDLSRNLGVPIGLIHSSFGGTVAEAWTSNDTVAANPDFKPIVDRWNEFYTAYPKSLANYTIRHDQWVKDAAAAKAAGQPPPKEPNPPMGPDNQNSPSGLYDGMIAPLIPYAIRGVIWYQGEYNCGRAYQYRAIFPDLIADWRTHWGEGSFPFIFTQLSNINPCLPDPGESAWAELREAQAMTLSAPNTAMAASIDIGDRNHIHPADKQDVGHRLALAARAVAYNQTVEWSGPLYKSMTVEGSSIRIAFTHIGGGLVYDGVPDPSDRAVTREKDGWIYDAFGKLRAAGVLAGADPAADTRTMLRSDAAGVVAGLLAPGMLLATAPPANAWPPQVARPLDAAKLAAPDNQALVTKLAIEFRQELVRAGVSVNGDGTLAAPAANGGKPLQGFAIAGEDHKFVWANARIDGDTVVVWSGQVPTPVAVRYGWADNPVTSLYNKAALPAVPFRTDNWPGLTVNNVRP